MLLQVWTGSLLDCYLYCLGLNETRPTRSTINNIQLAIRVSTAGAITRPVRPCDWRYNLGTPARRSRSPGRRWPWPDRHRGGEEDGRGTWESQDLPRRPVHGASGGESQNITSADYVLGKTKRVILVANQYCRGFLARSSRYGQRLTDGQRLFKSTQSTAQWFTSKPLCDINWRCASIWR